MSWFARHGRRGRRAAAIAAQIETCEERVLPAATVLDPNLAVRPAAQGLSLPVGVAFLGENDFLVIEKNSGRVKRVVARQVQSPPVLDLPVNNAGERGLLGIALHPEFYRTGFVYLFWTESSTGQDSGALAETPLRGHRVDRFVWNGSALTFDRTLIRLRALQPANPPVEPGQFGNHNGGVIRFGPDGKLYIFVGDAGRRGQMQNLANGPLGPGQADDQFGGPAPDNAHLTSIVLRLNDDGTTPTDNPFFDAGAAIGGEVGANIQRIYSYGHRNAIGMAFDPTGTGSGNLWLAENGDDAFTELNLVDPGMNGGWVQLMGPLSRFGEFRAIEAGSHFGLQQQRWSPDNLATTSTQALNRLFMLPGAQYSDPEFSWRYEIAPGGIGFLNSRNLGPQYVGDLFVGAAVPQIQEGHLFRFRLTADRRNVLPTDSRLNDRVADNSFKYDITESESLLFGRGFGISTDIQMNPNGNLYVVSLTHGTVYEIHHITRPGTISFLGRVDQDFDWRPGSRFVAELSGAQRVPPVSSAGSGSAEFEISADGTQLHYRVSVDGLPDVLAAYLQFGPARWRGTPVAVLFDTPTSVAANGLLAEGTITQDDVLAGIAMPRLLEELRRGNLHVSIHTRSRPLGELRGKVTPAGEATGSTLEPLDRLFEGTALASILDAAVQT